MAELISESDDSEKQEALIPPAVDISHLESQMVSMNFVLKNTQSEVIKLQKVLMRYQNRQEDLEHQLAKSREELDKILAGQQQDNSFRSRFFPSLVVTALVSILLSIWLAPMMHKTPVPAPVVPQETAAPEPPEVSESP